MQHELTEGDLLDDEGRLVEAGWEALGYPPQDSAAEDDVVDEGGGMP